MQKKHMIGLATFVVLTVLWFLLLSNSHMLDIFPCTELDYEGFSSSTSCGLIDVTRHAHISGAKLTTVGSILAAIVVIGLPGLVSYFIMKKMK